MATQAKAKAKAATGVALNDADALIRELSEFRPEGNELAWSEHMRLTRMLLHAALRMNAAEATEVLIPLLALEKAWGLLPDALVLDMLNEMQTSVLIHVEERWGEEARRNVKAALMIPGLV